MLCDGRMVCGCADPYGKRVLGDAKVETVSGDVRPGDQFLLASDGMTRLIDA